MRLFLLAAAILCQLGLGAEAQPACRRSNGAEMRDAVWQRSGQKHPLAGLVLKGERPILVEPNRCALTPLQQLTVEIWDTIRARGIVLLGEVHDNPEHHTVRAEILQPIIDVGGISPFAPPIAAFEHIRTTQQAQLDAFYAKLANRRVANASDLLQELRWETSGWPAAEIYLPLFDAAVRASMLIVAAAPDRERMRALVRDDRAGASDKELTLLRSSERMSRPLREALVAELESSHCGAIAPSVFAGMSLAQRYTDAHMAARTLEEMGEHGGAFLLAGNGHVRTDRGVPYALNQLAPTRETISVMLLEVEEGNTDPVSYLPRDPYGNPAADYVLFTPHHERPDPCEKMRQGKKPG
jgi:uncharacterized iron-regulated protein